MAIRQKGRIKMILNANSNTKKAIFFDTIEISREIDPNGGYYARAQLPQAKEDYSVFAEVAKAIPGYEAKTIAYIVDAALTTTASLVAKDGIPRKLGDLIKFYPLLRGKLASANDAFDSKTCTAVVAHSVLKGVETKMDLNYVRFVNSRTGVVVTINCVMSVGGLNDGTITKGKEIRAYGQNLQFDSALGDSVEVKWSEDGEEKSTQLTPTQSDELSMSFAWPEDLSSIPDGTELTFIFTTRAGIQDAQSQVNTKVVTLKAS